MKNRFRFIILALLLSVVGPVSSQVNSDGTLPFNMIDKGDPVGIKAFFEEHDVNGYYGEKELTPLTYAIEQDQFKIVKLLVKLGADVNQLCDNKTPLIHTVEGNKLKIAQYLVKKGASVNDTTPTGNTALIYTSVQGSMEMAQFLVKNRININKTNQAGKTALDYANEFNNQSVGDYLRSLHTKSIASYYPDYLDGPHIVWTGEDEAIQFYMKRDSAKDETVTESKLLRIDKSPFHFKGLAGDTSTYIVIKEKTQPPTRYTNVEKIIAIGDVHGGYDSLIHFLKIHGVIDSQLNWSWGDGHLVFMGDIFDRGEKVTECLWLIYKLEYQAPKQGGMVHLILGNHELLVMEENINDIAEKYNYMTNYLNIFYSDFYAKDTEFGRWLRTKNVAIKIGDKLFVHGGISPSLLEKDIGLEEMNQLIANFLTNRVDSSEFEKTKFLLCGQGPLWYRGYITRDDTYPRIKESDLDKVLEFFDVSCVIIGHTNVSEVKGLYHKKVFATDIPFYLSKFTFQALMIEDDNFFVLGSDGSKYPLK